MLEPNIGKQSWGCENAATKSSLSAKFDASCACHTDLLPSLTDREHQNPPLGWFADRISSVSEEMAFSTKNPCCSDFSFASPPRSHLVGNRRAFYSNSISFHRHHILIFRICCCNAAFMQTTRGANEPHSAVQIQSIQVQ